MGKPKTALFVSYNAATGPLVRSQVLPYLEALSKDGIKFTLFTFETSGVDTNEISDELRLSDIEWIRRMFHSRPFLIAKPFDIINGVFSIWRLCVFRKFRIVHCRGVMPSLMAIIPAKIAGAYFIFDMKSSLAEAYRLSGRLKKGSLIHRILSFIEKMCVLNADEVIVETEAHKKSLEELIGSRKRKVHIAVLPCCVDLKRFNVDRNKKAAYLTEGPRLVYLGSLSGWYLMSEMLDFFKAFKDKFPKAEFLFLTDDKKNLVAQLAKEKHIEGVRVFAVPYKDVSRELARSTAGILFKPPHDRLDSFPIKVGEYLASGVPLVINHGMGDVEALVTEEKVGVVVDSFDEKGYKDAISRLERLITEEGDALRNRCIEAAARRLSLRHGLDIYRAAYQRVPQ